MQDHAAQIPMAVHKLLTKTGAYEKVLNWLKRKSATDVLIVGASGAGKSSYLASLKGEKSIIRRDLRTDQVRKTEGKISSSYFQFWDTPGEQEHQPKREVAYKELGRLKEIGIINVVSYGYHEGTGQKNLAVSNGRPIESYLEDRRQKEMAQLQEWSNRFVGEGGSAKWILTVVTKADIWWESSADQSILDYYRNGAYRTALGVFNGTTPHSVLAHSSHAQMFYNEVPLSGFYTEEQRQLDRAAFVARLLENASAA